MTLEHLGFCVCLLEFSLHVSPSINVLQVRSHDPDVGALEPGGEEEEVSSPEPAVSLLSPKAMVTAGHIIMFEEEQREGAKVRHH